MPRVSVVLVTYNARPFLKDLFDSLDRQTFRDFEIVAVDNDSKDDTVEFFRRRGGIVLLPQDRNTGFAEGCNIGMAAARGEILFLLNQDTTLDPECVAELVRTMDANPRAAICGAKMLFHHEPGILNSFGLEASRFLYFWDRGVFEPDEGQYDDRPVLAVSGGAMAVRAGTLRGFDEAYFLYQEDVDFCLRAVLAGWDVITAPGAKVYHKQTFEGHAPSHRNFRNPANRLRTILKLAGWPILPWILLGHVGYECLVAGAALLKKDWRLAIGRIGAMLWSLARLPALLAKRGTLVRRRSDAWLIARTSSDWRPHPLLRQPDYRPVWDARVEGIVLPGTVEVGTHDPPTLGYGWGPRTRIDGRSARPLSWYGIVYLGTAMAPQLRIVARASGQFRGRVEVNGTMVGPIEFGREWSTATLRVANPREGNRVVLRREGPGGLLYVEIVGWAS